MNLSALGQKMEAQLSGGLYRDLDLLGNFMDNHDQDRVTKMCGHAETSRIFNSLAWTFFAQGIPILYYGTEVLMEEQRGSFWQEGWQNNTPVYKFVQRMNLVRRLQSLSSQEMKVLHTQGAADRQLVFQRGGPEGTWVFLNNNKMADAGRVEYCLDSLPKSKPGKVWVDALSGLVLPGGGQLPKGVGAALGMQHYPDRAAAELLSRPLLQEQLAGRLQGRWASRRMSAVRLEFCALPRPKPQGCG